MRLNIRAAVAELPPGLAGDSCREEIHTCLPVFGPDFGPKIGSGKKPGLIGIFAGLLTVMLVSACSPSTMVDISQNSTVSVKTKNGTIIVHDDGTTEQVDEEGLPPTTTFVKADGTVLPMKFDSTLGFQDGFAAVEKDGHYGFINTKGELVIKPQFDGATGFSEHLAAVRVEDKYGY